MTTTTTNMDIIVIAVLILAFIGITIATIKSQGGYEGLKSFCTNTKNNQTDTLASGHPISDNPIVTSVRDDFACAAHRDDSHVAL